VLPYGSLSIAAGLVVIGIASRFFVYLLGWILIGAGMGGALYDAATSMDDDPLIFPRQRPKSPREQRFAAIVSNDNHLLQPKPRRRTRVSRVSARSMARTS
jgi:hypothetical protein